MCEKTAHANPRYARGRPRLSHSAGFGSEMKSGTAGAVHELYIYKQEKTKP